MKNKLMLVLTPILLLLLSVVAYLKFVNVETDSSKFKKEYEFFNGKDTSYGEKYLNIKVRSDNPIKYSNYDEVIDVIENKTGIIYLGFPECPWCRNAIPVLLDAAKQNKVKTIYYLNILNDRDSYVVEDGSLVYEKDDKGKELKGTTGYKKLLKVLDNYLTDYTIRYEDELYETGEKRIYAPSVIFVKDGRVLGIHVSTVDSQTDPYKSLTDEENDELYSIYEGYINKLYSNSCKVGSSC
ncbi:MAG: hypothetical protein Q4E75_05715 [bacterium]|nr:hypothetical protein [bacterium]